METLWTILLVLVIFIVTPMAIGALLLVLFCVTGCIVVVIDEFQSNRRYRRASRR